MLYLGCIYLLIWKAQFYNYNKLLRNLAFSKFPKVMYVHTYGIYFHEKISTMNFYFHAYNSRLLYLHLKILGICTFMQKNAMN